MKTNSVKFLIHVQHTQGVLFKDIQAQQGAESESSPAYKDSGFLPETGYVPSLKLSGPSLSGTSAFAPPRFPIRQIPDFADWCVPRQSRAPGSSVLAQNRKILRRVGKRQPRNFLFFVSETNQIRHDEPHLKNKSLYSLRETPAGRWMDRLDFFGLCG